MNSIYYMWGFSNFLLGVANGFCNIAAFYMISAFYFLEYNLNLELIGLNLQHLEYFKFLVRVSNGFWLIS